MSEAGRGMEGKTCLCATSAWLLALSLLLFYLPATDDRKCGGSSQCGCARACQSGASRDGVIGLLWSRAAPPVWGFIAVPPNHSPT
jgi:hypothetical protein